MGFKVSWVARAGASTKELIEASGCSPTGERHEFTEGGMYLLEQPNWAVLIADGLDVFLDLKKSFAESLSQDGVEVLHFCCSDTVMITELVCFENGSEKWSILYSCDEGEPEIKGTVPKIVHSMLKELQAKQDADDGEEFVYELTGDVGEHLIGYRHDGGADTKDPEPFQVLSGRLKSDRKWWQFWK